MPNRQKALQATIETPGSEAEVVDLSAYRARRGSAAARLAPSSDARLVTHEKLYGCVETPMVRFTYRDPEGRTQRTTVYSTAGADERRACATPQYHQTVAQALASIGMELMELRVLRSMSLEL